MADGEALKTCPFFNDKMTNMPGASEMYRNSYCRKDVVLCARFMVRASGRQVPEDLFPNQKNRAKKILADQE